MFLSVPSMWNPWCNKNNHPLFPPRFTSVYLTITIWILYHFSNLKMMLSKLCRCHTGNKWTGSQTTSFTACIAVLFNVEMVKKEISLSNSRYTNSNSYPLLQAWAAQRSMEIWVELDHYFSLAFHSSYWGIRKFYENGHCAVYTRLTKSWKEKKALSTKTRDYLWPPISAHISKLYKTKFRAVRKMP